MKKNFLLCGVGFLGVSVLLPFVVSFLYKIGKLYPLIVLPLSQNEILSYIITVMGISISLVALFIALLKNEPKIKIKRTLDTESNTYLYKESITIINENPVEVSIANIGMISEEKRNKLRLMCTFNPNSINMPQNILPYSKKTISFVPKDLYKKISSFKGSLIEQGYNAKKVIFYVSLNNGKTFEYYSKDDKIYFDFKEDINNV